MFCSIFDSFQYSAADCTTVCAGLSCTTQTQVASFGQLSKKKAEIAKTNHFFFLAAQKFSTLLKIKQLS